MEYHIRCNSEDIAPFVILTRDPENAGRISTMFENARLVSTSRGYHVYTGQTDGTQVTVASMGIGGPQLAIGIEELAHMGARTFIKIAQAWPLSDELKEGDLMLPIGVYRGGATAQHYLPMPFPAVPDYKLARMIQEVAKKHAIPYRQGLSICMDAVFPPLSEELNLCSQKVGALTLDMDSDTFFILSSNYGWRSAAIQVISKQEESRDHAYEQGEAKGVSIALEAIREVAALADFAAKSAEEK